MCEEIHGERIEVMISTLRELDVPLGCNACEILLEKMKMNRTINVGIQRELEFICHHMGLRIFFRFPIELWTIAQDLGWDGGQYSE